MPVPRAERTTLRSTMGLPRTEVFEFSCPFSCQGYMRANVMDVMSKVRLVTDIRHARSSQIDLRRVNDAAGTARHDVYRIGKIHGFRQIMGHQKNSTSALLPQRLQRIP